MIELIPEKNDNNYPLIEPLLVSEIIDMDGNDPDKWEGKNENECPEEGPNRYKIIMMNGNEYIHYAYAKEYDNIVKKIEKAKQDT